MKTLLLGILGLLVLIFDRQPYSKFIRQWASFFHLKVRYHSRYSEHFSVDIIEGVLYVSRFNRAVHDRYEYFASVAHEFGHLFDYAYKEYYFDDEDIYCKLTDNKAIYRDEVVAWKIARILLQDAKQYDEKVFNELQDRCLQEYRTALKIDTKKKKTKGKRQHVKKSKRTKRSTAKLS